MRPTTTRQLCAYQRGYQAAKAGKEAKTNPHRKNTVGWTWWTKGFEVVRQPCGTCGDQGEVFVSKGEVRYGMESEPDPIYAACPDCD